MDNRSRVNIPKDLETFMELLAREAIRSQPRDILKFTEIFTQEIKRAKGSKGFDAFQSTEIYEEFRDKLHRRLLKEDESEELLGASDCMERSHEGEHKFNEDEAATKIQAKIRGYLVRKQVEEKKKEHGSA